MDALFTTTCDALRKSGDRYSEVVFAPGIGTNYDLTLDVFPEPKTTVYIDSPIRAGTRTPGVARGDRRCAICGSGRHDTRNCKAATPLGSSPGRGRHCSICGSPEHDRRKCPTVLRGEQKQDALVTLVTSPVSRRAANLSAGITARVDDLTAARLFFQERGEKTKKIVHKATTQIDHLTMERADLVFGYWLVTHLKWPFPSHREAVALGQEAGQSFRATQTWFSRARRDLRRYARQNTPGQPEESGRVYSALLVQTPLTSVPPTQHHTTPSFPARSRISKTEASCRIAVRMQACQHSRMPTPLPFWSAGWGKVCGDRRAMSRLGSSDRRPVRRPMSTRNAERKGYMSWRAAGLARNVSS
jgi:hypothetical protein